MTVKKQSKINQSNHLEQDKKSSSEQTLGLPLPTEKDWPKVAQSEPIRTLGSMMGEMVWLMSQSPIHKQLINVRGSRMVTDATHYFRSKNVQSKS